MNIEARVKGQPEDGPGQNDDVEARKASADIPTEEELKARQRFIGRVFLIVVALIVLTILQIIPVLVIPKVRNELIRVYPAIYFPLGIFLITMTICAFFPEIRHTKPYNIIILILDMESLTVMIMFITAKEGNKNFLLALCLAATLCMAISIFAIFIKADLARLMILVLLLGFFMSFYLVIGILALFIFKFPALMIFILYLSMCLLAVYFFFQIQELIHGRYKSIPNDAYIYVALILYTDFMAFVFLFMSILHLKKI